MTTRDSNGRMLAGPMDQELKDRISAGQVERHRRQRAAVAEVDPPDKKKCSNKECPRAGQWLRVPDDFYMRRRTLKSGGVRIYPSGECKECSRARADNWRNALGPEEAKRRQDSYNAKRNAQKKRRYNREYQRLRAFERADRGEQTLRGPWKRYRDEPQLEVRVPARGFVRWYLEEKTRLAPAFPRPDSRGFEANGFDLQGWLTYLGIGRSTYYRLERLAGKLPEELLVETVKLSMVDRILTRVGKHELLDELTDWRRMA